MRMMLSIKVEMGIRNKETVVGSADAWNREQRSVIVGCSCRWITLPHSGTVSSKEHSTEVDNSIGKHEPLPYGHSMK